jgi:hypothetical protein
VWSERGEGKREDRKEGVASDGERKPPVASERRLLSAHGISKRLFPHRFRSNEPSRSNDDIFP